MANIDFPEYSLEEEGVPLCDPCVVIALFSEAVLGSGDSPDLSGPYNTFVKKFGSDVSFCRIGGNQMHAKPIRPDDLTAWPNWLADTKRRSRGGFNVELRSGRSRNEWRAPSLEADHSVIGAPHSHYRISLPLTWFLENRLTGLLELLRSMLVGYPLSTGYVGYSFVWEKSSPHVSDVCGPHFRLWLQRHPGLLCPDSGSQSEVARYGITDLGWLTLLGPKYVNQLGGIDELRNLLQSVSNISLLPIGRESVLVQIDNHPTLGDATTGDCLENYSATGQVLSPIRNRQMLVDNLVVPGIRGSHFPEERARWIDRFFPTASN